MKNATNILSHFFSFLSLSLRRSIGFADRELRQVLSCDGQGRNHNFALQTVTAKAVSTLLQAVR